MSAAHTDPRLINQFNEYFKHWQVILPEAGMEMTDQPVRISHSGWWITIRFGADGGSPWMEIYAQHRMTNDRHLRFHVDRDCEQLSTLDEPVFIPEGATAEEEAAIHQAAKLRYRELFRELEAVGLV